MSESILITAMICFTIIVVFIISAITKKRG